MGDDQQFTLHIEFSDNDADDEARNAAYEALARDLREADAVVAPVASEAPADSKGGAALAETLSVTILSSSVSAFVGALGTWAQQRRGCCTVRMRGKNGEEYEFNGLDEKEIADLRSRFSMLPD